MTRLGPIGTALLAALALAPGCGPTQISRANREVVESLATAVSARNPEWLEENVKRIEACKAAGDLPDADETAFREIIDKAKSGDWEGAESAAFWLRDGQRPSGEDYAAPATPRLRAPRNYGGMPRRDGAGSTRR